MEENDTNVDLVILVCLLLTLLFDIFLIAIILAHEDLRNQVKHCLYKGPYFKDPGGPKMALGLPKSKF